MRLSFNRTFGVFCTFLPDNIKKLSLQGARLVVFVKAGMSSAGTIKCNNNVYNRFMAVDKKNFQLGDMRDSLMFSGYINFSNSIARFLRYSGLPLCRSSHHL